MLIAKHVYLLLVFYYREIEAILGSISKHVLCHAVKFSVRKYTFLEIMNNIKLSLLMHKMLM